MKVEFQKQLIQSRGIAVVPMTFRIPVELHGRLQRAVGELMVETGRKVSVNAAVCALLSDSLSRLEADYSSGSGSL